MMHTMCEEFHYVYFLFHDESEDLRILNSLEDKIEKFVIDKMWDDFNVFIRFFDPKEARHLKTEDLNLLVSFSFPISPYSK